MVACFSSRVIARICSREGLFCLFPFDFVSNFFFQSFRFIIRAKLVDRRGSKPASRTIPAGHDTILVGVFVTSEGIWETGITDREGRDALTLISFRVSRQSG